MTLTNPDYQGANTPVMNVYGKNQSHYYYNNYFYIPGSYWYKWDFYTVPTNSILYLTGIFASLDAPGPMKIELRKNNIIVAGVCAEKQAVMPLHSLGNIRAIGGEVLSIYVYNYEVYYSYGYMNIMGYLLSY